MFSSRPALGQPSGYKTFGNSHIWLSNMAPGNSLLPTLWPCLQWVFQWWSLSSHWAKRCKGEVREHKGESCQDLQVQDGLRPLQALSLASFIIFYWVWSFSICFKEVLSLGRIMRDPSRAKLLRRITLQTQRFTYTWTLQSCLMKMIANHSNSEIRPRLLGACMAVLCSPGSFASSASSKVQCQLDMSLWSPRKLLSFSLSYWWFNLSAWIMKLMEKVLNFI